MHGRSVNLWIFYIYSEATLVRDTLHFNSFFGLYKTKAQEQKRIKRICANVSYNYWHVWLTGLLVTVLTVTGSQSWMLTEFMVSQL